MWQQANSFLELRDERLNCGRDTRPNQVRARQNIVPTGENFYPYRDAVWILDEWFRAHPDERGLRDKLTISGLSSALKAEKRAELVQKLATIADVRVERELKIGRLAAPSNGPGRAETEMRTRSE